MPVALYKNGKLLKTFPDKAPASAGGSNKSKTGGDNEPSGKPTEAPVTLIAQDAVPIPKVFIDRLVLAVDIQSKAEGIEVHEAIWANHDTTDDFVPAKKPSKYQRAWKLHLPSLTLTPKYWPHLSYAYAKDQDGGPNYATKLRLEFVPVDLGPQGMMELDAFLASNVEGGLSYFVKHGHINRLDVAVDYPELTMADFHYLHPQGLTIKEWRHDGKLETFQAGGKQSNHTCVYDRGVKRKATKSVKPGKVGVRIERRLIGQHIPVANLTSIKNPLLAFDLVERCPGPPPGEHKPYIWHLFMAAANQTSLTLALAYLPEDKKKMYRAHLKQHVQPWWNPDASWATWPDMIKELMLAP